MGKNSLTNIKSSLHHFAIITFYVDPQVVKRYLHPRFEPITVRDEYNRLQALVSVVPFEDKKFHFQGFPWSKHSFGQTNYRIYVKDTKTQQIVVWFLGTTIDSFLNIVPQKMWKLPWHRGKINFHCQQESGRYTQYFCHTQSSWGGNSFALADSGQAPVALQGFKSLAEGLNILTHPLQGFYFRQDGQLGSDSVEHDRIAVTAGQLIEGQFDVLRRLNLWNGFVSKVHSVLLCPQTEFIIQLPPQIIK